MITHGSVSGNCGLVAPPEIVEPREIDVGTVRRPVHRASSARVAEVSLHFGLPSPSLREKPIPFPQITLAAGRIVLLLGPSGSGKTTALQAIDARFAATCNVDRIQLPADEAVVDCVAPWASLAETLAIMTSCGLTAPHLWVRRVDELSEGERFRARLACAIALQTRADSPAPLLCDEFCTMLHRRAAKAVSFNLHKLARRRNLRVVVASCHEDVIADLRPHTIVRLTGSGPCTIEERADIRPGPLSLKRRLVIEPGGKRDYDAFAPMHYRATDELGFVDKVFVLREKGGEALGIIVYAHAPLELSLRNQATGGYFSRHPQRLNRELRIVRRLVIHPDVRGCGLGHDLVRKTMPLVGTQFIECLAGLGEFNPVFEKAGMRRIGQCPMPRKRQAALDELRAMDIDPGTADFPIHVCRKPGVREIVARAVHDWYAATTGGGDDRVPRQSPRTLARTFRGLIASRPVYYLWQRRKA